MIGLWLNPRRILRLRRRRERLTWFLLMRRVCEVAKDNKEDTDIFVACFHQLTSLGMRYGDAGGFGQERVVKRLMADPPA